jgi:hypothetical protein
MIPVSFLSSSLAYESEEGAFFSSWPEQKLSLFKQNIKVACSDSLLKRFRRMDTIVISIKSQSARCVLIITMITRYTYTDTSHPNHSCHKVQKIGHNCYPHTESVRPLRTHHNHYHTLIFTNTYTTMTFK